MDIALIVVGLLLLSILVMWIFSSLGDSEKIDEAEEAAVRGESPQALEREKFEEKITEAQSNAEEIAMFSAPGVDADESNAGSE